jgi:membrane protein
MEDDIFGQAAKLSYYFLLAVFPLLLLFTVLVGFLAQTGSEVFDNLLSYAREMLPYSAFELVVNTLKEVRAGAGGGKFGFGLVFTLWAASSGFVAMIEGLNTAYEQKDGRPWWKVRLVALYLTVSLSVFMIVSTVLVLYGSHMAEAIAGYFGLEKLFVDVWTVLQWPVALVLVTLSFATLYRFGPDLGPAKRRHYFPGAVVAMLLWMNVSLLLRVYLEFFNTYNKTYGSLGAVIILLLWFYLAGAAILIGGEVNAEICDKASRDTSAALSGRGEVR